MIVVGDKVVFDPFLHIQEYPDGCYRGLVTGEVVEVNYAHKWFSVEYDVLRCVPLSSSAISEKR